MSDHPSSPRWVKPVAEYVPLVGFFGSYWMYDLNVATAVLVLLTILAVLFSRLFTGKIPLIPLVTAGLVVLFGGLTLVFDDERFIKMKPTIVQIIMGLVLLMSLRWKTPLLQTMLGQAFALPPAQWKTLSYRYALFFFVMAGLNEYIWRFYSTDFWVNFKFFGLTGLTFVFSISQIMYIMRYSLPNDTQAEDTHTSSSTKGKNCE